ncbi:hypothetical protein [Sphingomonas sp.]|uniref:hypothetical protein n=1 Tax=Sphingomonas sp. TaxID=28214 RepID=UPI000DB6A853|nr:hypothetical protein [Sphingomonas sp.]PZU08019.1 MAG: hypothetical protein DI605_14235 [Sphingomonas sp.]
MIAAGLGVAAIMGVMIAGVPGAAWAQASDAPRRLGTEDIAKLRARIASDKQQREDAAERAREEALRQEEDRRIAAAEAEASADYSDDEPAQPPAPNPAEVFARTFSREYTTNMAIVNHGNANVATARQGVIDEQRRREALQRAVVVRREVEAARAKRAQAASVAGAPAVSAAHPVSPQSAATASAPAVSQATSAETRARQLREQAAAERKRLAAAARPAEVATSAVSPASGGTNPNVMARAGGSAASMPGAGSGMTTADYGPAKAWCQASAAGTFQCMGPLSRSLAWEKSLDFALSNVGCAGGKGYNPTPGHGGSGFDCGRALHVGDFRMPLYDPYRGGGNPVRVTKTGQ